MAHLALFCMSIMTHIFFNKYSSPNVILAILLLCSEPLLILSFTPNFPANILTISTVYAYATFFGALVLSICIYRVSPFHPLAHIPGPPLSKITKLYDTYFVYTGHRHRRNKRLHEIYGPVVRIAPNEISFADVDALKPVLGELPKGPFYTVRAPNNFGSLLIITGDAHTQRRRRWLRGLNTQALKEYEEHLSRRTFQLVQRLEGIAAMGTVINFADWMNYVVFDFMGDMAFGGGLEMMKNPDAGSDPFWTILARYGFSMTTICQLPWMYNLLLKIPSIHRDVLGVISFGSQIAKARVERGTQSKDLWYHLLDEAGIEKEKPSLVDVVRDGALAVVAGADTSSAALCALFYCLLVDRKCYERAQSEVDNADIRGENVPGALDAADFSYVSACINEVLRLYPSLPTNGPREVPAGSGGKMVAGVFLPEGTQVYVPPYSMGRDPRYFWPEPDTFNPARWLESMPGDILNRDAFIPFSYGYANCVGKGLALQELLSITVIMLARFDLSFAPGFDVEQWPRDILDHLITTRPPMPVVLSLRT